MLRRLVPEDHPDLLVGADTGDDAAVWRLDDARALVFTTDIITPVVDDARTWGRVAAANAASDIYAMGGRPILALNLVAWPRDLLGTDLLSDVLLGASDAGREGGWVTGGGHSIDDAEPKFGLAIVGEVHPDQIIRNTGLRAGDRLVLTKPLGIGIITTAVKQGAAEADEVEAAVESMSRLNAAGRDAARRANATGGTDVTGFGLLGHLARMAEGSGVDVSLDVARVPLLPGAARLAEAGTVPGGTRRNLDWVRERIDPGQFGEDSLLLLADAQTSGGLLFGAEGELADAAVDELRSSGHQAAVVGRATRGSGRISLR